MKKIFRISMSLLIIFTSFFSLYAIQMVSAQDLDVYKSTDVQNYTASGLIGTMPDTNSTSIKTIEMVNGEVKLSFKLYNGQEYDILRSFNGGKYEKINSFPLNSPDFVDKDISKGYTYYYFAVVYDSEGKAAGNFGPYKVIVSESTASAQKKIVLQLDNQNASANGVQHKLDVKPYLKDGRTMVPLRFIIEALGAKVDWLESEQKITVNLNGNTIVLWVGRYEAKINNNIVYLDVPALVSNDRTVIPIRFVSENLKLKVDFNDKTNEITLSQGVSDKPYSVMISAPGPVLTSESALKNIVKSDKKYTGESRTSNGSASKYIISFNSYNEQTGIFKGTVEWVGYNTTDDIEGKLTGESLIFKQVSRHQNNNTTALNTDVSMKQESFNRISGTWNDLKTGTNGTTLFEFTPQASVLGKYSGSVDAKGFPAGKATVDLGGNTAFNGEVKVVSNNLIAIGTISYTDGTKVIGRFVNGKPDGMSSIVYPDQKAYLIDFKYGKPVRVYSAGIIPTFTANEIEVYKADDIDVFKADDIDVFKADDIDKYNADSIEPYKADMIEKFKAEPVELNSNIVTINKYEAEVATLNPPGPTNIDIPEGGFTSPDYMNPLVQMWSAHMLKLPYLMNNNMVYGY